MKIVQPDKNRAVATGKLFCDEIEENPSMMFHGTTCAYADMIEKRGFVIGERPYPSSILTEASTVLEGRNDDLVSKLRLYAEKPVRLSFSTSSLRALEYALKAPGGQTLGCVRSAICEIESVPDSIQDLLALIDAHDVCVYAIDVSAIPQSHIETSGLVRWISAPISPEQLVAKLIVPRTENYNDFTPPKAPTLEDIYSQMSSAGNA